MTDKPSFETVDDLIEKSLLKQRRVFLAAPVTSASATEVIRRLWYLESTAPGEPITLVINSPGGSIDAGFAVWDQIKLLGSPVTTLVTGLAASMGSVLSLCAAPGRRLATANSRIMIHQPSIQGDVVGVASDLDIHAREILRTRDRLIDIYVDSTGRSRDEIASAIDRDKWFTAEEALEYGLLDKVVSSAADLG